jgi:hypothetical protein
MYHYVFDYQNIDELRKMVNEVASDPNVWTDMIYKPRSDQPGEENTPVIELAVMLWKNDIRHPVV